MKDYKYKYLKYKNKYLELNKQIGGKKINIGLYIGRFQPLHIGHLQIIKEGIKNENIFMIIIGSIDKSNEKNPFSFEQRKEFIEGVLSKEEKEKLKIFGLRDSTEEDRKEDPIWWYNRVKEMIDSLKITENEYNIYLYGSNKDTITEDYLKKLQEYSGITTTKLVEPTNVTLDGNNVNINATDIREKINKKEKTEEDIKYLNTVLPENLKKLFFDK